MEDIQEEEKKAVNRPERCHIKDQVPESVVGMQGCPSSSLPTGHHSKICSYELQVVNTSNYQSKPCV
jgi:hypothetical protein